MSEVTLKAQPGRAPGSRPSGRLRLTGHVPAVVYGHGITPLPVSVDWRELRGALTTDAGSNALINLDVGAESHLTIVRDMQRDPIRHDVLHVDFLVVSRDEVISVDVPIVITGESLAVHQTDGATIEQQMHTITIQSKPGSIPNEITVDITELKVGDAIRVGDLTLPEGVATELDADDIVVAATVVQVDLGEEAEAAEGEEGAEGEGAAEGEAAAGETDEASSGEGDAASEGE
ncbi:MAG: large subunit ribosomal protein [Actinomycetota bacterium]|nr:large subunit ribosomal protein [Actinomycetota bacterium]